MHDPVQEAFDLLRRGEMQAAAERLDGLAPGPEVEGLRARVWLASGRREEAVALARTVVAAHPTAWSALLTLATSAVREGRATEADALIHRLERIHGGGGPAVRRRRSPAQ